MKKLNLMKQKGAGLISSFIIVILLGIIAIYGFKIGMGYMDNYTLSNGVENVLQEAKNTEQSNVNLIKTNIMKTADMNSIDLRNEDIVVTKDGAKFVVSINYIKEVKINKTMTVLMEFFIEKETE